MALKQGIQEKWHVRQIRPPMATSKTNISLRMFSGMLVLIPVGVTLLVM